MVGMELRDKVAEYVRERIGGWWVRLLRLALLGGSDLTGRQLKRSAS